MKIPNLPGQSEAESCYVSFYNNFLINNPVNKSELNDDGQDFESHDEGKPDRKYTTTYERDPFLRKEAIRIHGVTCKACSFNFYKYYGDYGKGLIHIHHKVPISEYGGSRKVDPKEDLIPLCPNCHAIVHRMKNKVVSVFS